jgi:putative endonuclease
MSVHLYILKSKSGGKYYVGITAQVPGKRLEYHNKGKVKSTRIFKPWRMIYFEEFKDYKSARVREKLIKSWKGGNAFKKLIARAAG